VDNKTTQTIQNIDQQSSNRHKNTTSHRMAHLKKMSPEQEAINTPAKTPEKHKIAIHIEQRATHRKANQIESRDTAQKQNTQNIKPHKEQHTRQAQNSDPKRTARPTENQTKSNTDIQNEKKTTQNIKPHTEKSAMKQRPEPQRAVQPIISNHSPKTRSTLPSSHHPLPPAPACRHHASKKTAGLSSTVTSRPSGRSDCSVCNTAMLELKYFERRFIEHAQVV
jgi:hypothetical protein